MSGQRRDHDVDGGPGRIDGREGPGTTGRSAARPSPAVGRREVVKAALGAGGAALVGRIGFPRHAAAQEATPAATAPPGLTAGVDFFPSPAEGVPDAYLKLPAPFASVAGVPGSGGDVSVLTLIYGTAPTPRDANAYWPELERRLGIGRLSVTSAPPSTYPDQLATQTAGGELPDLTYVHLGMAPSQYAAIFQGAYADLTDHLTGDALNDYPNLAAFEPRVWRNAAIDGRLYGVPVPRFNLSGAIHVRQDWAERVGTAQPADAEAFFQTMTAFAKNDPDGNGAADTFGLGSHAADLFCQRSLSTMFRVPNGWRLGGDGTLTNAVETDEFRAVVGFQRRLFAAGLYHPDTANMTPQQGKDGFVAGRYGAFQDALVALYGPAPGGLRAAMQALTPAARPVALVLPGHDGGAGTAYLETGYFGMASIPAAVGQDEARLRELLRILNWLAAPFGSEEATFRGNGLEGVHHTVGPDGTRTLIEEGRAELGVLPAVLMGGPPTLYFPHAPENAREMQAVAVALAERGIENPTAGLYSATGAETAGVLTQLQQDAVRAVVQGREPLEALDAFVAEWRTRGGDQIRQEYQEALAAQ